MRLTDAAVWYLAALQRPDGHWRTNERVQRPPLGSGDIHSTVLAMRSLQLYPLEGHEREFAERVERTRRWLLEARPLTHQERVFQLLGLGWSGASRDDLAPWPRRSFPRNVTTVAGLNCPGWSSDAFATGETLVALAIAGGIGTSHPVLRARPRLSSSGRSSMTARGTSGAVPGRSSLTSTAASPTGATSGSRRPPRRGPRWR